MMLPGAIAGVDVLTLRAAHLRARSQGGHLRESFFDGGGSPAGVISVKGSGDRKKAREVKEAWESSHGGVVNAHRPAVMFGDATWTPMTVSPENAQFLETRRLLREEICGFYGVPLQRIQAIVDNASQGGGKGLDAIDAGYVKHGLLPAFGGVERAWSRMLPGDQASWAAYDFDEFLRADAKERAEIAPDRTASSAPSSSTRSAPTKAASRCQTARARTRSHRSTQRVADRRRRQRTEAGQPGRRRREDAQDPQRRPQGARAAFPRRRHARLRALVRQATGPNTLDLRSATSSCARSRTAPAAAGCSSPATRRRRAAVQMQDWLGPYTRSCATARSRRRCRKSPTSSSA
jgi:hypothetical protein